MIGIEAIIWYLVLLDSIFAGTVAWCFPGMLKKSKRLKKLNKVLPLTKGWTAVYIILVLWVGYGLLRLGVL